MLFLNDAVRILMEGTNDRFDDILCVLEDTESPVPHKLKEKLYKNVSDRAYIDFGDIPKSAGDITKYSGYKNMKECLSILLKLGEDEKNKELTKHVTTVSNAVHNIEANRMMFMLAFTKKNDIAILDYNTYVFTCVEATSAIIYQFVDYIKTPSSPNLQIKMKNTKYRADLFFMQQLEKFNEINAKGAYSKYLTTLVNKGTSYFFGVDTALLVGGVALTTVALSIVPITRELIFQFKELKRRLSETCQLQADFLEMNKTCVESNQTFDQTKKDKILAKQEKLRLKLLKLSERLRVTSVKANELAKNEISKDNNTLSLGGLKGEISDSDFGIL